ncbi:MAG: hypothetical protein JF590_03220 [Gemmatimonadetes bacterium]|nr:hypothetical protein [Gemmatimonadota bacterium]
MLGTTEPGDAELKAALAAALTTAPCAPELVPLAWRAIELMDLGPVPDERIDALTVALGAPAPPMLPLLMPTGAMIMEVDAALVAGEALALRALTKAHRHDLPAVRSRLDALARHGPGLDGATRRASALHGIAADAVHYPTAVAKLVTELTGVQKKDGTWGEHDLFHVGQALLAVEHPDAERALRRGAKALEARQGADGGFGSEERSWIACRWVTRVGPR